MTNGKLRGSYRSKYSCCCVQEIDHLIVKLREKTRTLMTQHALFTNIPIPIYRVIFAGWKSWVFWQAMKMRQN